MRMTAPHPQTPVIFVLEDEPDIARLICSSLTEYGFRCEHLRTGRELLARAHSASPDLCIVDLGLPDKDGATLLSQWRRRGVDNPVLILTARDAIEDRIHGLDSGADDYLVKPFALAELQARARALIRRYQGHSDNLVADGDLTLNLQTQQVLCNSHPVEVTPKEFALLTRLIMRSGQTVHRETLQQDIYSWQDDPGSNTLEVHIHNLRRKLGKDRIKTVRGVGYRLENPQ